MSGASRNRSSSSRSGQDERTSVPDEWVEDFARQDAPWEADFEVGLSYGPSIERRIVELGLVPDELGWSLSRGFYPARRGANGRDPNALPADRYILTGWEFTVTVAPKDDAYSGDPLTQIIGLHRTNELPRRHGLIRTRVDVCHLRDQRSFDIRKSFETMRAMAARRTAVATSLSQTATLTDEQALLLRDVRRSLTPIQQVYRLLDNREKDVATVRLEGTLRAARPRAADGTRIQNDEGPGTGLVERAFVPLDGEVPVARAGGGRTENGLRADDRVHLVTGPDSDSPVLGRVAEVTRKEVVLRVPATLPQSAVRVRLSRESSPVGKQHRLAIDRMLNQDVVGDWSDLARLLCRPSSLSVPAAPVPPSAPGDQRRPDPPIRGRVPNAEQEAAISAAVATPHALVIQGPPGTGKTEVISQIVQRLTARGERVLLLAPMHVAVDELLARAGEVPGVLALRIARDESVVRADVRHLTEHRFAERGRRIRRRSSARGPRWQDRAERLETQVTAVDSWLTTDAKLRAARDTAERNSARTARELAVLGADQVRAASSAQATREAADRARSEARSAEHAYRDRVSEVAPLAERRDRAAGRLVELRDTAREAAERLRRSQGEIGHLRRLLGGLRTAAAADEERDRLNTLRRPELVRRSVGLGHQATRDSELAARAAVALGTAQERHAAAREELRRFRQDHPWWCRAASARGRAAFREVRERLVRAAEAEEKAGRLVEPARRRADEARRDAAAASAALAALDEEQRGIGTRRSAESADAVERDLATRLEAVAAQADTARAAERTADVAQRRFGEAAGAATAADDSVTWHAHLAAEARSREASALAEAASAADALAAVDESWRQAARRYRDLARSDADRVELADAAHGDSVSPAARALGADPERLGRDAVGERCARWAGEAERLRAYVRLEAHWFDITGQSGDGDAAPADLDAILLQAVNLVCATTVGVATSKRVQDTDFDTLIVDEASRVTTPEFLIGAVRARRWILVGDEKQLPPFVDQNHEQHLAALSALRLDEADKAPDIAAAVARVAERWETDEEQRRFHQEEVQAEAERMQNTGAWQETYRGPYLKALSATAGAGRSSRGVGKDAAERLILGGVRQHMTGSHFDVCTVELPTGLRQRLDLQHRMVDEIAALVREPVYQGRYRTAPDLRIEPLTAQPHFPHPVTFLDTSAHARECEETRVGTGCVNHLERRWVVKACHQWNRHLAPTRGRKRVSVSILSFYSDQAQAIKRDITRQRAELAHLDFKVIDAIDKIQGQESDLVIISFCRALASGRPGPRYGLWLQDVRRLNVAVTRARRALILVGHAPTLRGLRGRPEARPLYDNIFSRLGSDGYHLVKDFG